MILKRVEIYGFKSFGKKIVVQFDDEITAVVGPNGSGKSNIVDAIRWVMGEQRVKSMRLSKMEDVIFSGTRERKPLGFAQVSLILDNSNKILPSEYDEVNVTRRLFRSGESEYLINKTPSRLKDVQELFMDTGLGREGYSIVGQGQVESIINNSPQERKLLIEEAVGVVKYKVRKIEAERKLERAQSNLYRVTDILSEIESRLPTLKKQSEKAEKFVQYKNQLRDIEVRIFVRETDSLRQEGEKLYRSRESLTESISRTDGEIADIMQRLAELKQKIADCDTILSELSVQSRKNDVGYENVRIEKRLNESKIEDTKEKLENLLRESEVLDEHMKKLLSEKEQLGTEYEQKSSYAEKKHADYTDVCENMRILQSSYDESDMYIKRLRENESSLRSEISTINEKLQSLENERTSSEYVLGKINEENAGLKISIQNLQKKIRECDNSVLEELEEKKTELSALIVEEANKRSEYEQFSEDLSNMFARLQADESRYAMLNDVQNSMQLYKGSIRKLFEEKKRDPILQKGVYSSVGDLFRIKSRYTEALSKALAGSVDYVCVEDENVATHAIRLLKQNRWGRVTFLPLNIIRANDHPHIEKNLPGFISFADELADCDARFTDVKKNLLARILVVDTIDNANEVAKRTAHKFKIVTLDGEVLLHGGAMVGGKSRHDENDILHRKSEIERLGKSLALQKDQYEQMLSRKKDALSAFRRIQSERNTLRKEYELQIEQNQSMIQQQKYLKQSLVDAETKYSQNEQTAKGLCGQIGEIHNAIQEYTALRKSGMQRYADVKDALAKATDGSYKEDVLLLLEKKNSAEIAYIESREQVQSVKTRMEYLDNEIALSSRKMKECESNRVHMETLLRQIKDKSDSLVGESEQYSDKQKILQEKMQSCTAEKKSMNERYFSINEDMMQRNADRNAISERMGKVQSSIERIELKMDHLTQRMLEEYNLTYAACLEYKDEDIDVEDANERVKQLKNSIRHLGNINVDALEEYKELKERYDAMLAQKTDLETAKEDLVKIIGDISDGIKKQFLQKFREIQTQFNAVFKKLFNGGEAKLILTEPEDVMQSGVEIVAQPPNTKLKNIAALPGGEKTMTAISLIFAILELKPAPFCVLDEIDAALDDANAMRFCRYLQSIKNNNQFIMITHKKISMEIADTIYGASMGSDGVTQIVSVKLSEIDERGEVHE